MKEIQNFNDKGNENILTLVYENEKGVDITTSLIVAKVFGKRNSDVLRDVRNLNCSNDFRERNFALMVEMRQLPQGGAQKTEYYTMTKDGFSFLVMGYTGKRLVSSKNASSMSSTSVKPCLKVMIIFLCVLCKSSKVEYPQ